MLVYACYTYSYTAVAVHFVGFRELRGSSMNDKNAATRQDVIANSMDHEIFTLANSAVSTEQMETLMAGVLDHDVLVWPRQYLETYLDSDVTGRVPLDAKQLQDLLEAAFDCDAALALEYLAEVKGESRPLTLGDSTLEVISVRSAEERYKFELLFDPRDGRDLRYLIEKLDLRAWEKQQAQIIPLLEVQPDNKQREITSLAVTHRAGSGAMELHNKITGSDVRKLLGGDELPVVLQRALAHMPSDARIENAQTDSGTYRGRIIAETEKTLIQQITSHSAVVHRKDLLDMTPAVGENVRIAYSNDIARILQVKERSKTQELGR
jgi:hypothetical protein